GGSGLERKLVEDRRPRGDEHCNADEVSGGTGTSEAVTALTSTFRTAGCGPACPVVWEGSSGITAAPYPDYIPLQGVRNQTIRIGTMGIARIPTIQRIISPVV